MRIAILLVAVIATALINGCAATAPARPQVRVQPAPTALDPVDLGDQRAVRARLDQQYRQWAGVPHRTGGMSQQGVDCSALVYLTYRDEFGYRLPRTTELQVNVGYPVDRSDLRPGDLVFFRTRLIKRHVGIYMGEGRFMHVSAKKGVMVSRMDDYYWKDRFAAARRVN